MILLVEITLVVILVLILTLVFRDELSLQKKIKLIARLEKYWDGKERRRYVRFDTETGITYKETKQNNVTHHAHGLDVSDRGIRVLIDRKMEPGTTLTLTLVTDRSPKPIELEGAVVWCNEAKDKEDLRDKKLFHIGINIVSFHGHSLGAFDDYMASLEQDLKKAARTSSPHA